MRWLWRGVWNTAEFCEINLGRLAPFVFARMVGVKGARHG